MVTLLVKAGASPSALNKKGKTPMTYLLKQEHTHQIKAVLSILVGAGANVNEIDSDGNTHLHRICSSEGTLLTTVVVRSLLEVGADPKLKNKQNKSSLDLLNSSFEGSDSVKKIIEDYLLNGPPTKSEGFKLFVKTMSNTMYSIELPLGQDTTVLQLKEAIYQKEDVPPQVENNLKFGKILLENDNAKLSDLNIHHEDAVLSILVAKR